MGHRCLTGHAPWLHRAGATASQGMRHGFTGHAPGLRRGRPMEERMLLLASPASGIHVRIPFALVPGPVSGVWAPFLSLKERGCGPRLLTLKPAPSQPGALLPG